MTARIYQFPEGTRRSPRLAVVSGCPASVIILPVVNIDRDPDKTPAPPGRRRRRKRLPSVGIETGLGR